MKAQAPLCMVLLSLVLFRGSERPLTAETPAVDQRIAWTTSRLVGSPDPPSPYRVELAFPQLKFRQPLAITGAPGSERLFVAEQAGRIYSLANDERCQQADLVIDLKQARPALSAVYGLTFHPAYATNRFVYVCYVVGGEGQQDGTRVSRFRMLPGDPPRIDVDSERLIITWLAGGHNGGCLKFGPDGYLYISTGDATSPSPPDALNAGQDVSNLLSAILRIDVDTADDQPPYRIPADNPFVDLANARGEIWAYGFRNPWKMSFDRVTGELWVGDVGWELWEMIYRVQKGGNYGWSIMEGRQPVHPEAAPGPTPILPPTVDHPHSEAASITGGFVYRGQRLPALRGAYIYGDFQSGIVWGLRMNGDQVAWHQELAHTPLQLVGFGEDNAGELYLLDYRQQIFRLEENTEPDTSQQFPRKLSQTGLFASIADQQPAAGVIPYVINAEAWADGARAQRWLAVPGSERIAIDGQGRWQFPEGSVLAKTLWLQTDRDQAAGRQRLETQLLHRQGGRWRPYTYVWNQQQTDADLADASGFERTLPVVDAQTPDGVRQQPYHVNGRKECVLCHNPWVDSATNMYGVQSASPLAMRTDQLDCDIPMPDNVVVNQLELLRRLGLLNALPDLNGGLPLANPYDETADLDQRARAYLDVNCSHCHQANAGGTATILLSRNVALEQSRTVDVRPTQGTFGISDARIIAPGDPFGSVLFYRVSKLGGGRMPRVGSQEVDPRGADLIHDWIQHLVETPVAPAADHAAWIEQVRGGTSAQQRAEAIGHLTQSTRGALALMYLVLHGGLEPPVGRQIVDAARHDTATEVRDLFERFVPPAARTQRLGAIVDMTKILELEADAQRGQQLFVGNVASCKNCHRIQDVGERLGPDLSQIGKKYTPRQLLQQILEPSSLIDPQYVPYVAETTSGQIVTGLLERQTPEEVWLRDASNQLHRLATTEIELIVRQQKSLMPDLLLRDMTAQQVADLIAFLSSPK